MRAVQMRWRSSLGRWAKRRSVRIVVRQLAAAGHPVTPSAVYKWISGDRAPRIAVAHELVRMSRGEILLRDLCVDPAPESREAS